MKNIAQDAAGAVVDRSLLADYLTKAQIAAELHVSVRTVARWRVLRTAPKAVRIGNRIYFKRADVRAWLEQRSEVTA